MADKTSKSHGLPAPAVVVTEAPKFDLESYIANYEGETRIDRLITIGLCSKVLQVEALKTAAAEAKRGINVGRYVDVAAQLKRIAPDEPAAAIDEAWVEKTQKQVDKETERLEQELKGYKNNLIKESIRMGNEELGTYYYMTGDLTAAHRAYSRMREYCTTTTQIAAMMIRLILVAIAQENWLSVQQSVYRIRNTPQPPLDQAKIEPAIEPLLGLVHLASGEYRRAAECFVRTDAAFLQPLEPVAGGIVVNRHILSSNDVAVYGTLCALATFSRGELTTHVLESGTFRPFLEQEPHLRRAVAGIVGAKYTSALATLDAYRPDYLLDHHLQRHVAPLWHLLRRRCIVAYCEPFSRVAIAAMAQAFAVPDPAAMTAELVDLVSQGLLDARVDLVDGVLVSRRRNPATDRPAVAADALAKAAAQDRHMRLRLWRLQMLLAGWDLKPPVKHMDGRFAAQRTEDLLMAGPDGDDDR